MALVATMGTFCRESLRAKGLLRVSLIVQTLHLFFIVPVIWFGKNYGYNILIYIRSFAYLQVIILLHIFSKKYLRLSPLMIYRNTIWPALCAAVMGGIGFIFNRLFAERWIVLFMSIFLCVAVYFILLVLLPEYRNIAVDYLKRIKRRGNKNEQIAE